MIKNRKAFIVGLRGTYLNKKEITFLKKYKPWGIILFSRNIQSIEQTQKLTSKIKLIFKDNNFPILIDQEGGSVSRVEKLINTSAFTSNYFGSIFNKDRKNISKHINIYINQMSYLLRSLGININNSPVLDVRRKFSNHIIGNRAFSNNQKIVKTLGSFFIDKYHQNKIATVMKHIPGHGLAKLDSHKYTPKIKKNLNYLNKVDFYPFKDQKALFAMTAHIIYESIDPKNTATHSRIIIKNIRNKIKFKKIIVSDDISMKSLKFSIRENTIKAFNAGCNIVLHCNAKMSEMKIVAENSPKLDSFLMKKTLEFYKLVS
jgi:beta-N-acetylhexosaminidase